MDEVSEALETLELKRALYGKDNSVDALFREGKLALQLTKVLPCSRSPRALLSHLPTGSLELVFAFAGRASFHCERGNWMECLSDIELDVTINPGSRSSWSVGTDNNYLSPCHQPNRSNQGLRGVYMRI